MSSTLSEMLEVMPRRTMQGHIGWANGVVHLHGGREIITCSTDGSLRLWDLESGTQIDEDWRYENDAGVWSMALSPNGKSIASGSGDGDNNVKIWNIEMKKVIAKWAGHANLVGTLCWSGDGDQVLSGSWDGTARVWDVKSSKNVLTIETGHNWVNAVIYSPNATKIATGGLKEDAVKIWDAKTGKLLNSLKHPNQVWSLAWTSEILISGSYGPIRIFNTITWEEIAILEGHANYPVNAISLSLNKRLLASASVDQTARLWNLDTNLPVGPPLQHEKYLRSAALSPDGKLLVTGCEDGNTYTWDIHAILKEAGLEDIFQPLPDVAARESLMDADATQAEDGELSPGFFNDTTDGAYSSRTYGNHHRSSARRSRILSRSLGSASTLFSRLWSPFRRSHRNTDDANKIQQRPRRSIFSRGTSIVEVAAVKDREVIFTAPPPSQKTQQPTQSHVLGPSTTSLAPGTDPTTPTTPRQRYAHSLPVRLLAYLALFICCAFPQHANANAQPTQQQQGHSEDRVQAQASSSQTQPAAPSTSATPTALDTHAASAVAAST